MHGVSSQLLGGPSTVLETPNRSIKQLKIMFEHAHSYTHWSNALYMERFAMVDLVQDT